jgi:predicted dehydrogenase
MRWGVLGAADIALRKAVPGLRRAAGASVVAVASRSAERAHAFAAECDGARAYDDYAALLADDNVEAVYIPLPNHLHVLWTLQALEAGKHVLCEKPIALNAAGVEALIAVRDRSGRQVLEAFMVRQHPQWLRVRQIVQSGEIGRVRLVQACFGFFKDDPADIRNRADAGGGALNDVGCYAVVLGRYLFDAEPLRAAAMADRDGTAGVDVLTGGILDFGLGRLLSFTVSTRIARHQTVQVLGELGRIEIPVALNAPPDAPCRVIVDRSGPLDPSGHRVEWTPACDQYAAQAEAAMAVFRGEAAAEFPLEDSLRTMHAMDALARAGRSTVWEVV